MKSIIGSLAFLLLISSFSFAQKIVWNDANDFVNINKNIQFLEDKGGDLTFDQVRSDAYNTKFTQSKQKILNFGFTKSYYWLRFTIQNNTNKDLTFEIAHAFLPVTQFYYQDKEGKAHIIEGGYKTPMKEKLIKSHFQVFPIPKDVSIFYVKLLSNSHPLPILIWENGAYEIHNYKLKLIYGFYLGFMFFIFLLNIFFFFSLRNWLHLFYSFIILVYISYATMVMDGFIVYLVDKIDLMFWYLTVPTLGVVAQTIYCLIFLEVKKYNSKLNKIIWGVNIYFISYAIIKFFLPLIPILALNTVHALISFFIMGFVGIKVGKKGNKMGYYFAFAYILYFMLVLTEAVYIQTGSPAYFSGLSHVATATLLEAFLLSFLLSKRFEWEKEESERAKSEAQRQLLESTIEHERITRQQNIKLENEVAKRTENLKIANDQLVVKNIVLEQQKEEISSQADYLELANFEITQKSEEISEKSQQIINSITYAKRIQNAVLPKQTIFAAIFPEHFILFKPRNIVSGDFYFIKQVNDITFIAAADCTGHGVPGAFMSMLGIAYLNEIISKQKFSNSADVLNELRDHLKLSLQQTGQRGEQQDGMDIAFCAINNKTLELNFAGAHNPIWIFRTASDGSTLEVIEQKGDFQPVGVFHKEHDFTETKIQLQEGDVFYIFSDGYHSQFGGERNSPLKSKYFKNILIEIYHLPLEEQKQILEIKFDGWKQTFGQTDDVLVMGLKI